MPSSITPPRKWRSRLMSILGVTVAALWWVVLLLLCVPLWSAGIVLFKISNLCTWGAYRLRDLMELLGNKIEAASR